MNCTMDWDDVGTTIRNVLPPTVIELVVLYRWEKYMFATSMGVVFFLLGNIAGKKHKKTIIPVTRIINPNVISNLAAVRMVPLFQTLHPK